jgi:hypothetical protein
MALFDDEDALHEVVEALQGDGFERADLSVSPRWHIAEKAVGRALASVTELANSPAAPRTVPVDRGSFGLAQGACIAGPLYVLSCAVAIAFAAQGADLAVIARAGVTAGAMGAALGCLPVIWLRRWHQHHIQDLLARGGLILWVRIADAKRERQARQILAHSAARSCGLAA